MKNLVKKISVLLGILSIVLLFTVCSGGEKTDFPIESVPFTSVKVTDQFWVPKIQRNYKVTIPIAINQVYAHGAVNNFKIAGGLMKGKFQTDYPFNDTDIYKLIEAASYSLQTMPDSILEAQLDTLIYYISLAQEPDGYIYTSRTIDPENPHPWADSTRWTGAAKGFEGSHELYNCGHFFEAATAHYAATGKRNMLDLAIKTADLLVKDFGPGKLEIAPGHQVVEMGLVKMYEVTGKKEYLDLSKFFLDVRGPGGEEYSQAHLKVVDQREPVGHAVRATYMYSAMADIAKLYQDSSYFNVLAAIWEDLVTKKMYVTGGIGSGGGNEGFDPPYILPNMKAYCETCSSVGNIFWNYRMFMSEGDSKYYDVLERTLYNAFLSGVSLSGDRFFYPNVLESIGQHQRFGWDRTACCPPNLARLIPSIPGYIYAKTQDAVYVNLYMSNTASFLLGNHEIEMIQQTRYPWDGKIEITINPETEQNFALKLRVPGWIRNEVLPGDLYAFTDDLVSEFTIRVNNKNQRYKVTDGYAVIRRNWKKGDIVQIEFLMNPRKIKGHEKIKANRGKIALQRGPIVYAVEWPDAKDDKVCSLIFEKDQEFSSEYRPELLDGVVVLKGKARAARYTLDKTIKYDEEQKIILIPYYAWNNRGPGEMMVWLPINDSSIRPLPAPTIASTSKVSGSNESRTIVAVNDQLLPENSIDRSWPFYHWWPDTATTEWIQYDFESTKTISSCKVYWYDDGPFGGCRIPVKWELEYKSGNTWKSIKTEYPVVKDGWSIASFNPVKATALRMKIRLPEKFSAGIHEWVVK